MTPVLVDRKIESKKLSSLLDFMVVSRRIGKEGKWPKSLWYLGCISHMPSAAVLQDGSRA